MRILLLSLLLAAPAAAQAPAGAPTPATQTPATQTPATQPPQTQAPERAHDARSWRAVTPTFAPLPGAALYQGTMPGVQGEHAYVIEVPRDWNGTLVVYARGYAGEGAELRVQPFPLREALLAQGFAWAASSYSANGYDARAGVEDTGRLVNAFGELTGGRHPEPRKRVIVGVSMGGHVAAASVERETLQTAANPVRYDAALALCGVMDPVHQFNFLGDYGLLAATFAGVSLDGLPPATLRPQLAAIVARLFAQTGARWEPQNPAGRYLEAATMMLSGGPRPVFAQGFRDPRNQEALFGFFGASGNLNGVLARNLYDNTDRVYRSQSGPLTPAEAALNRRIPRVAADPAANPRRGDGVRWLPAVNGDFAVPVMSVHTLGDLFVPFSHQLRYLDMARANGNEGRLVQRAVRAAGHCDFAPAEILEAFTDLLRWEASGARPAGDVLTPANIARPDFGCRFTRLTRPGVAACGD